MISLTSINTACSSSKESQKKSDCKKGGARPPPLVFEVCNNLRCTVSLITLLRLLQRKNSTFLSAVFIVA